MGECAAYCAWMRELGADGSLVQGAGGNFAYKNEGEMHVKASGIRFADVTEEGCVRIELQKFRSGFRELMENGLSRAENELGMNELMTRCSHGGRATMETAMHSTAPRFTLHLHMLAANVLLCQEGGREKIHKLFADVSHHYIPYVSPGFALGREILRAEPAAMYFLENHGVLFGASSLGTLRHLVEMVRRRCLSVIPTRDVVPIPIGTCAAAAPCLFPDAAIFSSDEIRTANQYLIDAIIAMGERPRPIPQSEIDYLRSMDAEAHRQKIQAHT